MYTALSISRLKKITMSRDVTWIGKLYRELHNSRNVEEEYNEQREVGEFAFATEEAEYSLEPTSFREAWDYPNPIEPK